MADRKNDWARLNISLSDRGRVDDLLGEKPCYYSLFELFVWDSSASGFEFWDAEAQRLERGGSLSSKARDQIEDCRDYLDSLATTPPQED